MKITTYKKAGGNRELMIWTRDRLTLFLWTKRNNGIKVKRVLIAWQTAVLIIYLGRLAFCVGPRGL